MFIAANPTFIISVCSLYKNACLDEGWRTAFFCLRIHITWNDPLMLMEVRQTVFGCHHGAQMKMTPSLYLCSHKKRLCSTDETAIFHKAPNWTFILCPGILIHLVVSYSHSQAERFVKYGTFLGPKTDPTTGSLVKSTFLISFLISVTLPSSLSSCRAVLGTLDQCFGLVVLSLIQLIPQKCSLPPTVLLTLNIN